jgi:hypothetical protein
MIFNGDILSGVDLAALRAEHAARGADVTLHLTKVADPRAFGLVPTDAEGWVTAFREKPQRPEDIVTDQINAGCYVFNRRDHRRHPGRPPGLGGARDLPRPARARRQGARRGRAELLARPGHPGRVRARLRGPGARRDRLAGRAREHLPAVQRGPGAGRRRGGRGRAARRGQHGRARGQGRRRARRSTARCSAAGSVVEPPAPRCAIRSSAVVLESARARCWRARSSATARTSARATSCSRGCACPATRCCRTPRSGSATTRAEPLPSLSVGAGDYAAETVSIPASIPAQRSAAPPEAAETVTASVS